jgi:N-carbamoyl-L-amino-acid hydrolase
MPTINPQRLLDDLRQLRTFGAQGTGVVRLALSPVDVESRRWLAKRLTEAGLDARIDGIGTVFGRSRAPGKALLIGSHTDTQPTGGWLDGAMGVMYGLEIARAFRESPDSRDLAVDVASWMDEEGTYAGFIGSRSFCGEPVTEVVARARNREGQLMSEAIRAAGLADQPLARMEADRYVAYLEPHIEQGGRLEAAGKRIGVVTTIVGIRELRITFRGQQNHAGTTPMEIRRDAGAALIRFAGALETEFRALAGPQTVWNIGRVEFTPGSASIVPGQAEMVLQFRDPDAARLDALEAKVTALVRSSAAAGTVSVSVAPFDDPVAPTVMNEGLQRHIAQAAERHAPGAWMSIASAAGHDAQVVAGRLPCGMLFVPSIGGISHDFAEDTGDDDIVLGCQVAASAAMSILREGLDSARASAPAPSNP